MSENIFDDFDVKSKGEVIYSKMGLEKNPFHREGLPPRDKIVELYTKRGKEDKLIANELVEAYGTQLPSGLFLVGAWGNGKTHTMLYFEGLDFLKIRTVKIMDTLEREGYTVI